MPKQNVILTGFMATGKTVVGKKLAEQLGYEFVDTDETIEARAGMGVADIFREKGEAAFRRLEKDLAKELGEKEGLVVSTGGGLMLDPDNVKALSRNGRVFCLVATPEEILDRVSKDKHAKRPLLEVSNPMQRIVEIMARRQDGYNGFSQIVTSGKTPDQVTRDIIGKFRANSDMGLG